MRFMLRLSLLCTGLVLAACGGGGGGGSGSGSSTLQSSSLGVNTWTSGIFQASSNFVARCASPRTGTDPFTGDHYPDTQGSALTENNWLRSWTNELYLWYDQVADVNPAGYATADYFNLLKTTQVTASGAPRDKFHFTYATPVWESLSQNDLAPGYGLAFSIIAAVPPREAVIAYVDPSFATSEPGITVARGAEVVAIDGVDLANSTAQSDLDTLNEGISPVSVGESHTFTIRDLGAVSTRTITLQSVNYTATPVQNVGTVTTSNGKVGYLLFNDHVATAESALVNAINTLNTAGISDLVLDIRYNGGGFLDIASELAYMIAGPGPTAGKAFDATRFNNKYPTIDPVTLDPLTPTPFHTTSQGFSVTAGLALPTLNLTRVFVLTGPETCSASEAVMNGLRGVGVEVIQIGSTTCGKPYGFYPQDNCGTTYFSIEFQGVNAQGFGDYTDGFSPANSTGSVGAVIPGCSVADDFTHPLGDPLEGRFAAALDYRVTQNCPSPPSGISNPTLGVARSALMERGTVNAAQAIHKSPFHENLILRR